MDGDVDAYERCVSVFVCARARLSVSTHLELSASSVSLCLSFSFKATGVGADDLASLRRSQVRSQKGSFP